MTTDERTTIKTELAKLYKQECTAGIAEIKAKRLYRTANLSDDYTPELGAAKDAYHEAMNTVSEVQRQISSLQRELDSEKREQATEAYRAVVKVEIAEAKASGQPWTKYRPFVNALESMGAMKCSLCKKPSSFVSYCIGLAGRTALCEKCYQKNNR